MHLEGRSEAGILGDRRVELLAGEVGEMRPETPTHYNTTKRGTKYLEELLAGKADVRFNGPITLSDSEPEPDILIARSPESAYQEYWVLNLSAKQMIVFRYAQDGEYAIEKKLEDGIMIPLAFPDIRVSVERLLG